MAVKVGSFAKSTSAAPVDQALTGFGFQPKALVLWTARCTDLDTYTDDAVFGFGMTGTDKVSGAIAFASDDNAADSNVCSRQAAKALTIVGPDSTTLAECVVKTWDSDGVTLTWDTNDGNAYLIHYMALGGTSLTNAKVVQYLIATGTTGTDVSVTGVGFQPDTALHSTIWAGSTGAQTIDNAQPSIGVQMPSTVCANISAMMRDAQATSVAKNYSYYSTAGAPVLLRRINLASAYASVATTTAKSLDADGFTFTVTNDPVANCYAYALCLKGGSYAADVYNDNDATEAVTGLAFQPEGALILSCGVVTSGSAGEADAQFSVGAFTGASAETCAALWDDDAQATTNGNSYSTSTYSAVHLDGGSITNGMNVTSIDAGGFSWSQSENAFGVIYLAMNLGTAATAKNWQHYAAQMGRVM